MNQGNLPLWELRARELRDTLDTYLCSTRDFLNQLNSLLSVTTSPLTGIVANIVQNPAHQEALKVTLQAGLISGPPRRQFSRALGNGGETTLDLSLHSLSPSLPDIVEQVVVELIQSFWKTNLRDTSGLVVVEGRPESRTLLNETIQKAIGNREPGKGDYFVYVDLDNFSQINEQSGHQEGDRAIKHVAKALTHADAEGCIALHRSGDEFYLLLLNVDARNLLGIVLKIKSGISGSADFPQLDSTWGVQAIDPHVSMRESDPVSSLADKAEKLTKRGKLLKAENKKRGCIVVSQNAPQTLQSLQVLQCAKAGLLFAKSKAVASAPFQNAWLNYCSKEVFQLLGESWTNVTSIPRLLETIEKVADLEFVDQFDPGNLGSNADFNFSSRITKLELAIATSHGIARQCLTSEDGRAAFEELSLEIGEDANKISLSINGNYFIGERGNSRTRLSVAPFPAASELEGLPNTLSKVLLIEIGARKNRPDYLLLSDDLFAATVIVDDRPSLGGGLPDFADAAMAQLYAEATKNPNISHVAILGDVKNAKHTVRFVENDSPIDIDLISAFTGLRVAVIQETKDRLKGQSFRCGNADAVLELLIKVDSDKGHSTFVRNISEQDSTHSRLVSTLSSDKMRLPVEAGIACRTASDAYPTILEIIRSQELREDAPLDDTGRKLTNLPTFKLTLSEPEREIVPDFYRNREADLKAYFDAVFDESSGLLGLHLAKNGQMKALVRHIVPYLASDSESRFTRRAVAVIENIVTENELHPLGLIAIQATPRRTTTDSFIDFSFVWRTVEAIVGLPFSLYGSIRLAQRISSRCSDAIEQSGEKEKLRVGHLTYIALSLHMHRDQYDERIAKRIADEARK